MKVSVVATVKNEEDRISEFLDSLLNQTRRPDEIIIADGHSTDRTSEIIRNCTKRHPLIRLVDTRDLTIGEARNRIVKEASNETVAVVNCDRLDPRWLENLIAGLTSADISVGICENDAKTLFEKCVSELTLPKVPTNLFSPAYFAYCAFRRNVWEKVGGYPDSSTGEDTSFAFKLKDAGFRIKRTKDAVAYMQLPKNFRWLFWKKFWISEGDARLRQLSKFRHQIRRWTLITCLAFLGGLTLINSIFLPILLLFIATIVGATIFISSRIALKLQRYSAVIYVPAIIFVNETGHALGAVYGMLKRGFDALNVSGDVIHVADQRYEDLTHSWWYPNVLRLLPKEYSITLDVGMGCGFFLPHIKGEKVGLEVNKTRARMAKKNTNANILVADALHLPFRDGVFDLSICTEVLEHLRSPERGLKEIHRVLRNCGCLICSVPNLQYFGRIFYNMSKLGTRKMVKVMQEIKVGHKQGWDNVLLTYLLHENDFEIDRYSGGVLPMWLFKKKLKFAAYALGRIFPTLSSNLIVKCRKK